MNLPFFVLFREFIERIAGNPLFLTITISLSVAVFVGSLALLPVLAALVPEDYFLPAQLRAAQRSQQSRRMMRALLHVLKNLFGLILLAAGFFMLFIPGQGLLTIFLGVLFLNFPGKRALELKLIRHPAIYRGINKLRALRGKGPLYLPE